MADPKAAWNAIDSSGNGRSAEEVGGRSHDGRGHSIGLLQDGTIDGSEFEGQVGSVTA
jgi:hypothetical protein